MVSAPAWCVALARICCGHLHGRDSPSFSSEGSGDTLRKEATVFEILDRFLLQRQSCWEPFNMVHTSSQLPAPLRRFFVGTTLWSFRVAGDSSTSTSLLWCSSRYSKCLDSARRVMCDQWLKAGLDHQTVSPRTGPDLFGASGLNWRSNCYCVSNVLLKTFHAPAGCG